MTVTQLEPGTVKLCSLREVEHAEYVVAARPDMFGLIFAEARRRVEVATARAIVDDVESLSGSDGIRSVGVFVDQSAAEINRIADAVGLDLVQLQGSEAPAFVGQIERPVIRAFRSAPGVTVSHLDKHMMHVPSGCVVAVHIEGFHAGQPGGSGAIADWAMATEAARRYPVILAGGLTPDSVGRAIATVRPTGVDVSSGVEVNGQKCRERMISFVHEARLAFTSLTAQSSMSI